VPSGSRHTLQRGSGRLQFGQAIGRVEGADADEEAASQLCQGYKRCMNTSKNEFAENRSCPDTTKGRAGTLDAASKPRALGRSACLCSLLDLGNGMVAEAAAPQALRRGCDDRFGSSRGGCCDGNVQLAALQRHMSVRS
jgi:hypothetical protein